MIVGVVVFVVGILISIMLHEAGHFVTAKRFGMKATQFFLGFGPTLFSFRRGETEYGVKAVPAGGFVKIIGMTQLEEVDPADEPRAFYRAPAPQRAAVLAAGSFMHFVIAFVSIFAIFSIVGQSAPTPTVASVSSCLPSKLSATCTSGPESPALRAGVRPGDRIVALGGTPVKSWDAFSAAVKRDAGKTVPLTVVRDGHPLTLTLRPASVLDDVSSGTTHDVGFLGVSPATTTVRAGPLAGIADAGSGFGRTVVASFSALGQIPAQVPKLLHNTFSGTPRSATGLTSVVGVARASGQAFASPGSLADRVDLLIGIIASLNIFIGIFNLLPLLPLDGGHLAVLGFEQARAGVYRLLRRPSPGRVDLTKLLPAAYLVVALFVGLSALLIFSDIANPIRNPFTG